MASGTSRSQSFTTFAGARFACVMRRCGGERFKLASKWRLVHAVLRARKQSAAMRHAVAMAAQTSDERWD